jgi:hypothetical protein
LAIYTPFVIHWIYSGIGFIGSHHKGAKIANQHTCLADGHHFYSLPGSAALPYFGWTKDDQQS